MLIADYGSLHSVERNCARLYGRQGLGSGAFYIYLEPKFWEVSMKVSIQFRGPLATMNAVDGVGVRLTGVFENRRH
jgi:hypothetical protein